MTRSLHAALEETLGFIQRALDRFRAGDNADAELHNVRAYLVNVLELVERDPGIEAASDDLYQVAAVLAEGSDKGARMCAAKRAGATDRSEPAMITGEQGGGEAARVGALPACATC